MPEYRAYAVGDDGHFSGYEPLVCADDREAIAKAKIVFQGHGVELWSGPRLVGSMPGRLLTAAACALMVECLPLPAGDRSAVA
jgi:hypothetical protein